MSRNIIIHADAFRIDSSHIYIYCPFCPKDGRRHSKYSAIHRFGSNNNLNNRIEYRGGDCDIQNFKRPKYRDISHHIDFQIHITDETARPLS